MLKLLSSIPLFTFVCHKPTLQRLFPAGLPAAVGPYSPVTTFGNTVYISGQIPLNPETGNVESQTIEAQAHQVMKNLQTALKGAGCTFNDVAKTTILLTNMADFAKVNEVYSSYFEKGKYPARMCYAVNGLPKNSLIEIDAVAHKADRDGDDHAGTCNKTQHLWFLLMIVIFW